MAYRKRKQSNYMATPTSSYMVSPKASYMDSSKRDYMGSPWASDSYGPSSFYESSFMSSPMGPMISPFMQGSLSSYGRERDVYSGYDYRDERQKDYGSIGYQYPRGSWDYPYEGRSQYDMGGYKRRGGGSPRGGARGARKTARGSPRGGNRGGNRGKNVNRKRNLPNNQGRGGKKAKRGATEPYNPEEPTLEEEDDAQKQSNDSDQEKSTFGANAPSQDQKYPKKPRRKNWCTVCEAVFPGSFLVHRRSKEHRKHRDKKFPRCRLCRITFKGMQEFEAHSETEEHKQKSDDFQALKEQQVIHAALSDSEDEAVSLKKYIDAQDEEKITDEDAEPIGLRQIVPAKILLCKLCQKIFQNHTTGRQIHCRTVDHIQNYKIYFEAKEERAAERKRIKDEQKKAAFLARKAKLAQKKVENEEAGEANGEEENEDGEDADEENLGEGEDDGVAEEGNEEAEGAEEYEGEEAEGAELAEGDEAVYEEDGAVTEAREGEEIDGNEGADEAEENNLNTENSLEEEKIQDV